MKVTFRIFSIAFLFSVLILSNNTELFSKSDEKAKAREHFRRLIESAHPTPDKRAALHWFMPLDIKNKLPRFLNVSAIDDEESEQYKMQNESSIAVNPRNPMNLIASAVDYRARSSTWVYVSHDGGHTWENINLGKPFQHWNSTNDPSVVFDNEGVGYLCYGGLSADTSYQYAGENSVLIAKTTDEGRTWKAHIPVIWHLGHQTLDSVMEDKYYIHADNSPVSPYYRHLYIPWKRVTPRDSATQIVISKSTDQGDTWSEPLPISHRVSGSSEDTTFGQSFPLTVTGPGGEVYTVWNHGIVHGVGFVKSTDGGKTFSEPRIIHNYEIFGETIFIENQGWRHGVKGKVRAEAYPAIVCDITEGPRRGWLYLTWSAGNPPDVFFSRSSDGGDTWSSPKIVHSVLDNDQFWQWIALDPLNGDLAIMYLDSRNDPANIMVDCYVSYSSDGGDTWADRRASDIAGDLRLNPFFGNSFAGDYSGCAFYDGKVYPSWIDMRNSVKNIFDSDVFTAIVNVRAPEPPEPFEAKAIPEEPEKIKLTWEKPKERAFGQPMADDEFEYKLYRGSQLIATLPGRFEVYEDAGLNPYQKYEYSIYTVSGKDSSLPVNASSYSGGSRQPMPPSLVRTTWHGDQRVELTYLTPSLRADGLTPLVNFHVLELYRDSKPINKFYFNSIDTAKEVTLTDYPIEKGYYKYFAVALDSSGNPPTFNVSEPSMSEIGFFGDYDYSYSDNFDTPPMPKYYISPNWKINDTFFKSAPNSLCNAPSGMYANNQNDTLWMFPVLMRPNSGSLLTFWHCAFVKQRDSAIVEVSFNSGYDWEFLAFYNERSHEPWADGEMNADDWKREEIYFGNHTDDLKMAIVRFRFSSDILGNAKGWYIDDVNIEQTATSVGAEKEGAPRVSAYPNPAQNFVNIELPKNSSFGINSIKIYDAIGCLVWQKSGLSGKTAELVNISELGQGVYTIVVNMGNFFSHIERIAVIK